MLLTSTAILRCYWTCVLLRLNQSGRYSPIFLEKFVVFILRAEQWDGKYLTEYIK
jgi:hypothetical protein